MADQRRPGDDDRTRVIPTAATPRGAAGAAGAGGGSRGAGAAGRAPDGAPGQGVRRPGSSPAGYAATEGAPPRRPLPPTRRRRRVPVKTIVLLVVLALIAYPLALLAVVWTHLGRVDALPAATPSTPGRTYLVVGSDSREGLTRARADQLHTGSGDVGQRTDTIMLLHVPAGSGPTVLMSIPRDSYVAIPGHGHNKINAAFAFGGPKLLAKTIEQATGVQIDDYAEIGFGGFADMVDAVGGVQICPKRDMKDKDAGLNIKKGCQQADGAVALGYARARHSDPRGDLGRVERQREVLAAIVAKATQVATLINPFRTFPLASSGAGSLTVDQHTGPIALARFVFGMKAAAGGKGLSMTVPVAGTADRGGAGSVVLWDESKARKVFAALKRSDTEALRPYAQEQKAQLTK